LRNWLEDLIIFEMLAYYHAAFLFELSTTCLLLFELIFELIINWIIDLIKFFNNVSIEIEIDSWNGMRAVNDLNLAYIEYMNVQK